MTGVVLSGGRGTRLEDVLPGTAKTVAPVRGRPFLFFPLEHIVRAGVAPIILCTGHLADQVRDSLGSQIGAVPLLYSQETSPLGTGGAIRRAFSRMEAPTPWLVANGDSYLDFDVRAMLEHHRGARAAATIAVVRVPDGRRFGEVEWSPGGNIVQFREKTGLPGPKWINGGVYIFDRRFLDALPEGTPLSLEKEVFPDWVGRGLSAFPCAGRFIDIGTPDSYQLAQNFFEAGPI